MISMRVRAKCSEFSRNHYSSFGFTFEQCIWMGSCITWLWGNKERKGARMNPVWYELQYFPFPSFAPLCIACFTLLSHSHRLSYQENGFHHKSMNIRRHIASRSTDSLHVIYSNPVYAWLMSGISIYTCFDYAITHSQCLFCYFENHVPPFP